MQPRRFCFALALALMFSCGLPLAANETDQFTLPPGQEWVDLGPFLSRRTYDVLQVVAEETNRKIAKAIHDSDEREQRELLSARYIAKQVYERYGMGFSYAARLEDMLDNPQLKARHPGEILSYRTSAWIYEDGHFALDPRKLAVMAKGSTIQAYGTYFGTDKLGHFHHLGYLYFKKAMSKGSPTQEAAAQGAIKSFSKGLVSEGSIIGKIAAGVYSNADLAANYVGMKFYFNLTMPARIQGRIRPPLLVRRQGYWALNEQVTPEAPLFEPFISEHFNEALNPCVYSPGLRGHVSKRLRQDAQNILAFYCDDQGQPRPREYFEGKVQELWTYFGENYGHSQGDDNLVTIAAACFAPASATPTAVASAAKPSQPGSTAQAQVDESRW